MPILCYLSIISKSGPRCKFRIILITPHIPFPPQKKQSMPFPHLGYGPLGAVMLFSSIQITTKFGLRAASKVPCHIHPFHLTKVPTWFQGIILPSCILFFMLFHLEELHILQVQTYFSLMLSISILNLSWTQLARDNQMREVLIQNHQLGCISWGMPPGLMDQSSGMLCP